MATGSEQVSSRWVEGAERICVDCGREIKNLARDVGVVRSRILDGRWVREILCMDCRPGMKKYRARREARS